MSGAPYLPINIAPHQPTTFAPVITLIAGTNRPDSMTLRVARHYHALLKESAPDTRLLSLEGREIWHRGEDMLALEKEYLLDTSVFFFIVPEYNGSFPGALKLMMDNTDIKRVWWGKKAAITGLADGRAGNLRGLDHLTNILNYLKVEVWHNKLPISRIGEEMSDDGTFKSAGTRAAIEAQVMEVLGWGNGV